MSRRSRCASRLTTPLPCARRPALGATRGAWLQLWRSWIVRTPTRCFVPARRRRAQTGPQFHRADQPRAGALADGRLAQARACPSPAERLTGDCDIFHSPDFTLPPLRQARGVVTVHDLSFLRLPECADPGLRDFFQRIRAPLRLRTRTRVLADSESTKADLIELLERAAGEDQRRARRDRAALQARARHGQAHRSARPLQAARMVHPGGRHHRAAQKSDRG